MKTLSLAFLAALIVPAISFAFESGDRLACYDSVSNFTYQIKIMDVGDQAAWVRVKQPGQTNRFYSAGKVILSMSQDALIVGLVDKEGHLEETLAIDNTVKLNGVGEGTFEDRADSRALDCKMN